VAGSFDAYIMVQCLVIGLGADINRAEDESHSRDGNKVHTIESERSKRRVQHSFVRAT
jgi:hypothetical protein